VGIVDKTDTVNGYSVGEKVRVTDDEGHCFKVGAVYRIVGWSLCKGLAYLLSNKDDTKQLLSFDQFEKVEEEVPPESALTTQVGGDHYLMPIQPIEFIVQNEIPYREGNAIKYICRHKKKNGKEDIKKAIHYLKMILEDYND
jgi:hypothetical protein